MAQKFIVLGFKKTGGEGKVLAEPSIAPQRQLEILHKFSTDTAYAEVQMFRLEPHTRAFRPQLQAEADSRARANATSNSNPNQTNP